MIQIYQFSTGIKADRNAQGNWFSRGFTGQYMNSTLPVIPEVVQRSIRNKEFAVAEGAYSREPAIVARVVPGEEEPSWSVVATVTQGRDEYERPFSAYRYFLCEGEELWQLLAWLESLPQVPVFSPFEAIETYSFAPPPPPYLELSSWRIWLEQESIPAILKPGHLFLGKPQYLQVMNQLAEAKSPGQPIAWAYNVEALEQPRRFALVQVASEKAEEMLRRSLVNAPLTVAPVADDQAIKSAVKSLTNSSQMKPEVIQTIAAAMGNPKVTAEYWKEIFDGQGATKAIRQKLFSPQIVRLLTLRAIILQTTLPEFLTWLNPQLNAKKQSEHCETSLEFQSGLYQQFSKGGLPQIDRILKQGVEALLLQILKGKVAIDAAVWVMNTKGSIWARHKLVHSISQDLVNMAPANAKKNLPQAQAQAQFIYGDELWKILKTWWSSRGEYVLAAYKPLAVFFGTLAVTTSSIECAKVASYFYQVAYKQVPDEVFGLAFQEARWKTNIFGLRIRKELTVLEKTGRVLLMYGGYFLIPLLIVLTALLVKGIWGEVTRNNQQTSDATVLPSPEEVSLVDDKTTVASLLRNERFTTRSDGTDPNRKPDQSKLDKAYAKFYGASGTCYQLQQVLTELRKQFNGTTKEKEKEEEEEKIKSSFTDLLKLSESTDKLFFDNKKCSEAHNGNNSENQALAKRWIAGIYIYQHNRVHLPSPDGVIESKKETEKNLKCDFAQSVIVKKNDSKHQFCEDVAKSNSSGTSTNTTQSAPQTGASFPPSPSPKTSP